MFEFLKMFTKEEPTPVKITSENITNIQMEILMTLATFAFVASRITCFRDSHGLTEAKAKLELGRLERDNLISILDEDNAEITLEGLELLDKNGMVTAFRKHSKESTGDLR